MSVTVVFYNQNGEDILVLVTNLTFINLSFGV